eukprot:12913595-Prorocentrum_lima.AAC.1
MAVWVGGAGEVCVGGDEWIVTVSVVRPSPTILPAVPVSPQATRAFLEGNWANGIHRLRIVCVSVT